MHAGAFTFELGASGGGRVPVGFLIGTLLVALGLGQRRYGRLARGCRAWPPGS
jgi:hypothetical protein